MWCCISCKAENKISSSNCVDCGAMMPQRERDRIYKEQLKYAQKKQVARTLQSVTGVLKPVLGDTDVYAENFADILLALVKRIKDIVYKYRIIFIGVLAVLLVIPAIGTTGSYSNRKTLQNTHRMSSVKREVFNEHASAKFKNAFEQFGFYVENPANSVNPEFSQLFEDKKAVLADNTKKITDSVTEFVKDIVEEIKK